MRGRPADCRERRAMLPEIIKEEKNFLRDMRSVIEPELAAHLRTGCYRGRDGTKLSYRRYEVQHEKAQILIIHGFSEFAEKYHEMVYVLLQNGYSVFIPELRGHGASGRKVSDRSLVDVESFEEYLKDLHLFTVKYMPKRKAPRFLLGHSMGGGIAIRYLERYPADFDKAVLSSPMVRMQAAVLPLGLLKGMAQGLKLLGLGEKFVATTHAFAPESRLLKSSCKSRARYEYVMDMRRKAPDKQTWRADYNWTLAALDNCLRIRKHSEIAKLRTPMLVLIAGNDHMVRPESTRHFTEAVNRLRPGLCHRVEVPGGRHELYHGNEPERKLFYTRVLSFWES